MQITKVMIFQLDYVILHNLHCSFQQPRMKISKDMRIKRAKERKIKKEKKAEEINLLNKEKKIKCEKEKLLLKKNSQFYK